MQTDSATDFARVRPLNQLAKQLFSRCYLYAEKEDPFHLQFMIPLPKQPSASADEPVESSTEYDSHDPSDPSNPSKVDEQLQEGYFILSLEDNRMPEFPHLGWRCGRGSRREPHRGVDLLLAKPGDIQSKSLASTHFTLGLSPQSGLLVLVCRSKKDTTLEINMNGSWTSLSPGEKRVMYQMSTSLRVGRCEFEVQYTISPHHHDAFIAQRNVFLRKPKFPKSDILEFSTYLPGDNVVVRGRYLQFTTVGHGTFGWVSRGIDTWSGNLIAIKECRIKSQEHWLEIKKEVDFGRLFRDEEGLLPLIDACCEHGIPDPCRIRESYYFYMPYARNDLSTFNWFNDDLSWDDKCQILKQPLQGLNTLHREGIMHRDIRRQNILLLSLEPVRVAICDFGKAIKAESSNDTSIGPVHTLAPEVWSVQSDGPYTNSIDIWAFGYTIAEILGYRGWQHNPQIEPERHTTMMAMLQTHASKFSNDEGLVDLTLKLLDWNPQQRLTVTEALQHKCWDSIKPQARSDLKRQRETVSSKDT